MACEMGCSATCNAVTSTCDLALDVGLYHVIDLAMDKPELANIDHQPINITIDRMTYEVVANTLTIDTPLIELYTAPISVMEPNAPGVEQIASIAPVSAGIADGSHDVEFTPTGKQELVEVMSMFMTPFNLVVGSKLLVRSGQMIPNGRLDLVIRIEGEANAN